MGDTVEETSEQQLGFDLKRQGQERAADARIGSLQIARLIALELSQSLGESGVTADDVRRVFTVRHLDLPWGNFAGLIFKSRRWRCLGFAASSIAARRGGMLRRWIWE